VLENIVGGKLELVDEIMVIVNRMTRLQRDDPDRIIEKNNFLAVIAEERSRRHAVPRAADAFPLLSVAAPPPPPPPQPQAGPPGAQGPTPPPQP